MHFHSSTRVALTDRPRGTPTGGTVVGLVLSSACLILSEILPTGLRLFPTVADLMYPEKYRTPSQD